MDLNNLTRKTLHYKQHLRRKIEPAPSLKSPFWLPILTEIQGLKSDRSRKACTLSNHFLSGMTKDFLLFPLQN